MRCLLAVLILLVLITPAQSQEMEKTFLAIGKNSDLCGYTKSRNYPGLNYFDPQYFSNIHSDLGTCIVEWAKPKEDSFSQCCEKLGLSYFKNFTEYGGRRWINGTHFILCDEPMDLGIQVNANISNCTQYFSLSAYLCENESFGRFGAVACNKTVELQSLCTLARIDDFKIEMVDKTEIFAFYVTPWGNCIINSKEPKQRFEHCCNLLGFNNEKTIARLGNAMNSSASTDEKKDGVWASLEDPQVLTIMKSFGFLALVIGLISLKNLYSPRSDDWKKNLITEFEAQRDGWRYMGFDKENGRKTYQKTVGKETLTRFSKEEFIMTFKDGKTILEKKVPVKEPIHREF